MAVNIWRPLLVDKIGIVVKIVSKDLYAQTQLALWQMIKNQAMLVPNGHMYMHKEDFHLRLDYYPASKKGCKQSRRAACIELGMNVLFGLGKQPHRYFKLTLHLSDFLPGEFGHFKSILEIFLPDFRYSKLYETGRVNYLELAIDSLSHTHHSFLAYRKYVNKSDIYQEDSGHLGTTYVGSNTSDTYFRIYDKAKEQVSKGKMPFIAQLPQTRIEFVARRPGISPANLTQMDNPFLKLLLADLEKAKALSSGDDWALFLSDCLCSGVPAALAARPEYTRKKFRMRLDSVPASWWNPHDVWTDMPKALAALAP